MTLKTELSKESLEYLIRKMQEFDKNEHFLFKDEYRSYPTEINQLISRELLKTSLVDDKKHISLIYNESELFNDFRSMDCKILSHDEALIYMDKQRENAISQIDIIHSLGRLTESDITKKEIKILLELMNIEDKNTEDYIIDIDNGILQKDFLHLYNKKYSNNQIKQSHLSRSLKNLEKEGFIKTYKRDKKSLIVMNWANLI